MLSYKFSNEIPGILELDIEAPFEEIIDFIENNMKESCQFRLDVKLYDLNEVYKRS